MSDPELDKGFFDDWIGATIDLTDPCHPESPSVWKLETKLGHKFGQWSAWEYFETGWTSGGYSTFICHSVSDPSDIAVVKIVQQ